MAIPIMNSLSWFMIFLLFIVGAELVATDKWGNKMHSKPVAHQRPSSSKYISVCVAVE